MLREMAEPLGEECSVTARLLRTGLGLQTSWRVNVFFPAKGRILFEQPSYTTQKLTLIYKVLINRMIFFFPFFGAAAQGELWPPNS